VSARAGQPLWVPPDVAGHCCATPWSSKGYREGQQLMARRMASAVLSWTREGELPLLLDASSCTQGLLSEELRGMLADEERERLQKVRVIDSIEWVHDRLLGTLRPERRLSSVALHPPCAALHLGLAGKLRTVAEALAEDVLVPLGTGCCGMAGDRGLLHPELPASALAGSSRELAGCATDACLCANRTCEIALQAAGGRTYESFVAPLERLTRAAASVPGGGAREPAAGAV